MSTEDQRRILDFLSGCVLAMQTLGTEPVVESLPRALQRLVESASIHRAGVYEFGPSRPQGSPAPVLVAESRAERAAEGGPVPATSMPPAHIGWSDQWYNGLRLDRVIRSDADPAAPRRRSVVAVPIDIDGELWGFLRLDFSRTEVLWTDLHESVARSLASFLGVVLGRRNSSAAPRDPIGFSLDQIAREREIAFELDHRGFWTFLSPAWDRLTGYPAQRALGSHHSDYLFRGPSDQSHPLARLDLLSGLDGSNRYAGEGLLKTDDGSCIWVSFSISPVAEDGQERSRFRGLLVDIQERKAAEDKERASARELQRKNEELLKALMAAQEATRLQGNFLATMSHEIRTPLNGVLGMTSLLLQTSLDRQQREFTRAIQSSAESLLSIVNSILDYSKLEAQRVELEEVHYDPREIAEDVCASLAEPAARKRVDLVIHVRYPLPGRVLGDPGKVRQVLLNLIGNAIKFSKKGEVGIVLSWESLVEPAGELRFEVIDSGIGMSPETLDRLFRPFSQAEPATSRLYGGTGLGLAISKQLCELMGGDIFASSQLGVGSRFHVVLRSTAGAMAETGWKCPTDVHSLRGKHALLAGFGELSAQAWFHALSECGISAQRSQGLRDTLEILTREPADSPTDLIVFDTQSLEGGGAEINRAIRLAAQNPNLLLVLLDTIHDPVDRTVLKGVDPLLVLGKPISPYRALTLIAAARSAMTQTPRKPIQRMVDFDREPVQRIAPAFVFATGENRRKGLSYLLRRIGVSSVSADNFQDLLQRALAEDLAFVLLDADLGLRTELEVAQKLRSAMGVSVPPLVGVAGPAVSREHLQGAGLFDAVLEEGFQRDDLRTLVEECSRKGPAYFRASAS